MNSQATDLLEDRLISFTQSQQFSEIEPRVLHAIKLRFIDTIEKKVILLAKPLLGMARCRGFLDWAWRMEEADPIGEMFPLLAIP